MSDDGDMMTDEQEIVWDELTLCYEENEDLDDGARRAAVFSTLRNSCLDSSEQNDLINKMGWPWSYDGIAEDGDEDFDMPDDYDPYDDDPYDDDEEWDDTEEWDDE